MSKPGYLVLHQRGELLRRLEAARALSAPCELCPHRCRVNRTAGEVGVCRMGALPKVSSWTLYRWEEPPISGTRGSGGVFFSGCTGRCLFCQSYPISQLGHGAEISAERLAEIMVELQRKGAHNINLITATHFLPQILEALAHAVDRGLRLPLVWNTSGYERVEVLQLLEGIVDLWLPDCKYADDRVARRLSGFQGYVSASRAALCEIYRQVGDELVLDADGIAQRGVIIRHLVLPGGLAGTAEVLNWISTNLSPRIHVSLMDQYFPAYRTLEHPILGRRLTWKEYSAALDALDSAGLENGWCQTVLEEESLDETPTASTPGVGLLCHPPSA